MPGTVISQRDRILFIDHDENERQIITESALRPYGYDVAGTGSGNEAMGLIKTFSPDVILLDLSIRGVSSADILVALNAHAIATPVILIGGEGEERAGLNAFRLGAKDFIYRPIRETELIQVLERALKEVRFERDRERLLDEVKASEQTAKNRLREMFTLMGMGKTVTSLTNLSQVFEHVIRASLQLTQADTSGIYLRNEESGQLILRAGKNLSATLQDRIGKPMADELAEMVMDSRETLIAANETGWRPVSPAEKNVRAVIYAPLVVHDSSLGLLWVSNNTRDFDPHMANLMGALADYTSIALVNAHLFSTMQERTRQLESAYSRLKDQVNAGDNEKNNLAALKRSRVLLNDLKNNMQSLEQMLGARGSGSQRAAFDVIYRQINEVSEILKPFWM